MLLAHVLFSKYGLHLPLNRQSATYAREGVELDVSTLADWVGACAATLMPLVEAIRAHVFAAERIHADDTTVRFIASQGSQRPSSMPQIIRQQDIGPRATSCRNTGDIMSEYGRHHLGMPGRLHRNPQCSLRRARRRPCPPAPR
jgi:hypothetical protein